MILIKNSETRPGGWRAELRDDTDTLWAVLEIWDIPLKRFITYTVTRQAEKWLEEFTMLGTEVYVSAFTLSDGGMV